MLKSTIIFPSTSAIAGFVRERHVSNALVDSYEMTLTAPLSPLDISIAVKKYQGELVVYANRITEEVF